jgi:hypothetical protein
MDDRRVAQLLELLRQRTREEITLGVMALGPSFTPEMWRALELLREEQSSRSYAKPEDSRPWLGRERVGNRAIVRGTGVGHSIPV